FSQHVSLAELGFMAADSFGAMLAAYRQQTPLPDTSLLRRRVQQLTSGTPVEADKSVRKPASAGPQVVWTEYERVAAQEAQARGKNLFHIVAQIDPLCAMPIAARQLLANALSSTAQVLGARPEPGSPPQGQAIELLVATNEAETVMAAKCHIPTVIAQARCFPGGFAPAASSKPEVPSAKESAKQESPAEAEGTKAEALNTNRRALSAETLLRVDAERIDTVLNLVGELIIGKSMLQQTVQEYTRRFPKDPLRSRFQDAMAFQSRVLNDLQRSVMKIRMV